MEIGGTNPGFKISARGLSVQRKRMNLIAENIANAESTRTADGKPFKRKYLTITQKENGLNGMNVPQSTLKLFTTDGNHFSFSNPVNASTDNDTTGLEYTEHEDNTPGEMIFMPNHPDADEKGYVEMSNINVIQEMVEMIAASRSYEANLTALNASKQISKESLEI